jgi:ssDNA-binding Zn-finger/Zn-ribbon topoisomerase 1
MKLVQWMKHLGEGCCEIECDNCKDIDNKFYCNVKEPHNHGMITCPKCGNKQRLKDVMGLYFIQINYDVGSGGKNWQCGNCGAKFIFHDGQTEENIQCPACGWFKPTSETTQEIIVEDGL